MFMLNHLTKDIMCRLFFPSSETFFFLRNIFKFYMDPSSHSTFRIIFKNSSILCTKITSKKSSDTDSSVSI